MQLLSASLIKQKKLHSSNKATHLKSSADDNDGYNGLPDEEEDDDEDDDGFEDGSFGDHDNSFESAALKVNSHEKIKGNASYDEAEKTRNEMKKEGEEGRNKKINKEMEERREEERSERKEEVRRGIGGRRMGDEKTTNLWGGGMRKEARGEEYEEAFNGSLEKREETGKDSSMMITRL